MSRAALAPHDRAAVTAKGRRIAAALVSAALNPAADLAMADRIGLAALAVAVEAEVARRTGADPPLATRFPQLAAALAAIERGITTPKQNRGVHMTRHDQHSGAAQPDPGRSGKRPRSTKRWQRPDEARPGPRHPQRAAMRAAIAQHASVEVAQ